jgi:hypothetical protein
MTLANTKIEFPVNQETYTMPEGEDKKSYNYRVMPNFWYGSQSDDKMAKLRELSKLSFDVEAGEDAGLDIIRMASNVNYDLYNNGGGNGCYWTISSEMKSAVNAIFNQYGGDGYLETGNRILNAFSDLVDSMDEEWFPLNKNKTHFLMEVFMTEIVYAVGKHMELK